MNRSLTHRCALALTLQACAPAFGFPAPAVGPAMTSALSSPSVNNTLSNGMNAEAGQRRDSAADDLKKAKELRDKAKADPVQAEKYNSDAAELEKKAAKTLVDAAGMQKTAESFANRAQTLAQQQADASLKALQTKLSDGSTTPGLSKPGLQSLVDSSVAVNEGRAAAGPNLQKDLQSRVEAIKTTPGSDGSVSINSPGAPELVSQFPNTYAKYANSVNNSPVWNAEVQARMQNGMELLGAKDAVTGQVQSYSGTQFNGQVTDLSTVSATRPTGVTHSFGGDSPTAMTWNNGGGAGGSGSPSLAYNNPIPSDVPAGAQPVTSSRYSFPKANFDQETTIRVGGQTVAGKFQPTGTASTDLRFLGYDGFTYFVGSNGIAYRTRTATK